MTPEPMRTASAARRRRPVSSHACGGVPAACGGLLRGLSEYGHRWQHNDVLYSYTHPQYVARAIAFGLMALVAVGVSFRPGR